MLSTVQKAVDLGRMVACLHHCSQRYTSGLSWISKVAWAFLECFIFSWRKLLAKCYPGHEPCCGKFFLLALTAVSPPASQSIIATTVACFSLLHSITMRRELVANTGHRCWCGGFRSVLQFSIIPSLIMNWKQWCTKRVLKEWTNQPTD